MRDEEDEVEEDWNDESDDGYVPCPHCGEAMLEDAEYCSACDRWMTTEDRPQRRSWWVIAIVLALLFVLILSALRF